MRFTISAARSACSRRSRKSSGSRRRRPRLGFGPRDVGRLGLGVARFAEGEVAQCEPHHVVPADPELRLAALVEAVGAQEAAVQVAHRPLRDVLHHGRSDLGKAQVRQRAAAGLDLAGDGERVPEGLAEPRADQELLLRLARVADPGQERGVGRKQVASPRSQRRPPPRPAAP
jgi:hypothetical protein